MGYKVVIILIVKSLISSTIFLFVILQKIEIKREETHDHQVQTEMKLQVTKKQNVGLWDFQ